MSTKWKMWIATAILMPVLARSAPLQITIRQSAADGATRKADSRYRLSGMFGFGVSESAGQYYLWGGTNIHRKAWRNDGNDMHDLVFPSWTPNPCDQNHLPQGSQQAGTKRHDMCGDAGSLWYKSTFTSSDSWTYNTTTGGTATAQQFAAVGAWPYQWVGDVPNVSQTGFPNGDVLFSPAKLNPFMGAGRISPKTDCTRSAGANNPQYLATGSNNPKGVKVGSTWYIALNTTINNPQSNGSGGWHWTAGDTFRVAWMTVAADGKTILGAKELFYGNSEDYVCGGGLLLTDLFVDNGYFYMLAQVLYEPYLVMLRAPVTPAPTAPQHWQLLTNSGWATAPSNGVIDAAALNAKRLLDGGLAGGHVRQAGIARVYTSSAAGSASRIIALTNRTNTNPQAVELWMSTDLTNPSFVYQSDVRTGQLAGAAEQGWEFEFTSWPDNTSTTPRNPGSLFDLWLTGAFGWNPAVPQGQVRRNVVYRTTATLSGDIFSPRAALKAYDGVHYVSAANGGGSSVNVGGGAPGDWERLTIVDRNGGTLQPGDQVNLMTINGRYLSAVNGGGYGVTADRDHPEQWETFTIEKKNGTGTINPNDLVAFRSYYNYYLVAESAGGTTLNCNRTSAGAWETFTYIAQ
jgi:hypothetical protein